MVSIIKQNQFKAQSALLETLISLIFHVEQQIVPYAEQLFEVIQEQVKSEDALTKKVSIDAVYALTAIIKDNIVPFRVQILTLLMPLRSHKVKPVREATIETIKILKETGPPIEES